MRRPEGVEFLGGAAKAAQVAELIPSDVPRVVFAGRSNVGKSSLLNALTGERIARVSAEPGRTREMNFFAWKNWILADLPGYGFAKVSKSMREEWGKEISEWLASDEAIACVVVLVDGRHGFQPLDIELVGFLRQMEREVIIAFTKMDKYKSRNQRSSAQAELKRAAEGLGLFSHAFVTTEEPGGMKSLGEILKKLAGIL